MNAVTLLLLYFTGPCEPLMVTSFQHRIILCKENVNNILG